MVTFIDGNLFASRCEGIVNTVNCVGAMGKGIALEFALRYPQMEDVYKRQCASHEIQIGTLTTYRSAFDGKFIINFPTKTHFRLPSRMEYLEAGLASFISEYRDWGVSSVAFPLLGTSNGGLDIEDVTSLMVGPLGAIEDLHIEVYRYDAKGDGRDWLFSEFVEFLSGLQDQDTKGCELGEYLRLHPEVKNFSQVVNTKVVVCSPDGKVQTRCLATKRFVQKMMLMMTELRPQLQQQLSFPL